MSKLSLYKILWYLENDQEHSDATWTSNSNIKKLVIRMLGKKLKYKYIIRWKTEFGNPSVKFLFKTFAEDRMDYLKERGLIPTMEINR